MKQEILAIVDMIAQEKGVDREIVFEAIEGAMSAAIRKKIGAGDDLVVSIDRKTGDYQIYDTEGEFDVTPQEFGRIAAQAMKQGLIQKLREAERDVTFEDFEKRVGKIATGKVQRFDGENILVNLGKVEGILPREERVRGENFHVGSTIRVLIADVKKVGTRVKIICSRASAELVKELFRLEVPEIADGIIEIKRIVREPGYRTKVAVLSHDAKIDCTGACVGVRGSRIRSITDELNGEKIDIVKWSDSLETLVVNALKPAEIDIDNIFPDEETRSVLVLVEEKQLSLAIGKRGQNVRLASRLCGWDIDIKTRAEYEAEEMALRMRQERLDKGEDAEQVDAWFQDELARVKQLRRAATGEDEGDGGGAPAASRPDGATAPSVPESVAAPAPTTPAGDGGPAQEGSAHS
ncbi:MAG TPA: transcription termination factor NusA [Planctomycetota bacterium]|nr:transcription termination factor NusA [Planctomycetota bacterium]